MVMVESDRSSTAGAVEREKAANKIPGMNSLAGIHDVFQVDFDLIQNTQDGLLRTIGNVPAMIPAAVINYTALATDLTNPYVIASNTKRK